MKKKPDKNSQQQGTALAKEGSVLLKDLPALVEHCCCRRYEDGDPREPGWFTVKTQGAAWVVQVKDPDSACAFSAVGDTLDKALESAELLLGCDEAPWEQDAWLLKNRKGGRRK